MKAVIPAAGLGTRFLPYTKAQPKEMIPVVDKPALQYVVEEAVASGLYQILIVTGRGKRAIEDHFDENVELENRLAGSDSLRELEELRRLMATTRILYVRQSVPKGLGDAVLHAESFVQDEPFAVLLGDDITLEPPCAKILREAHERLGGSLLALQRVPQEQVVRYGMVIGDEVAAGIFRVTEIIEKPSRNEVRSTLATIGRYLLDPEIFDCLRATQPDRRGEIQLTDAIRRLLAKQDVYGVLYPGRRYDVGDKAGWLAANLEFALRRTDLRDEVVALLRRASSDLPPQP